MGAGAARRRRARRLRLQPHPGGAAPARSPPATWRSATWRPRSRRPAARSAATRASRCPRRSRPRCGAPGTTPAPPRATTRWTPAPRACSAPSTTSTRPACATPVRLARRHEASRVLTFDVRGTPRGAARLHLRAQRDQARPPLAGQPHRRRPDPPRRPTPRAAPGPTSSWWRCTGAPSTSTNPPPSSAHWPTGCSPTPTSTSCTGTTRTSCSPCSGCTASGSSTGSATRSRRRARNRPDTYRGLLVRVQLVRDASGRWRGGRLDWVASGITTTPAYRWADLSARALGRRGHAAATSTSSAPTARARLRGARGRDASARRVEQWAQMRRTQGSRRLPGAGLKRLRHSRTSERGVQESRHEGVTGTVGIDDLRHGDGGDPVLDGGRHRERPHRRHPRCTRPPARRRARAGA